MQQIISWNVASVRSRMPVLIRLLNEKKPDILLLQEIKATEENFPFLDFKALGYNCVIAGQKAYNGVAILSKTPLKNVLHELPKAPPSDPVQARFIQATLPDETIVISVYVPNGTAPMKDRWIWTRNSMPVERSASIFRGTANFIASCSRTEP